MNTKTFPIILILVAIAAFLAGITVNEKMGKTSFGGAQDKGTSVISPIAGASSSPLSIDNLKKYAVELKLDSKKFNQCLDNSEQANKVKKDIELATSLNINGTPAFLINGRLLGGAFPFESFKEIIDKELAGKGSDDLTDYSAYLQDAGKSEGGRPAAFIPKAVKIAIDDDDPAKGPKNAKVTIVEFSDFQCPFCIRANPTVQQVWETYKDDIRLVFKQLPLVQIHPFAQKAAEASLCANVQGKFWEYHDKLFTVQASGQ